MIDKYYSPIALFVYNRPEHTLKVLEALSRNPESTESNLYIFSDGPAKLADYDTVAQVRRLIRNFYGFKSISIIEQDKNLGLAASIIGGVTQLLKKYSTLIVIEDDLVVSSHFLEFMNSGLRIFRDEERVGSIHGYTYPVKNNLPETFFLRGGDCWGWATWDRTWYKFCPDGGYLMSEIKRLGLIKSFNLDGAYPFYRMLKNQVHGKNNSWAIRWHASLFLQNMLTLYPGKSLVSNIGHDGSGVHSAKSEHLNTELSEGRVVIGNVKICEDEFSRMEFKKFLWKYHSSPIAILRRIFQKLLFYFSV